VITFTGKCPRYLSVLRYLLRHACEKAGKTHRKVVAAPGLGG
jgi:hypothetical protein